jgi:hypothetical protein
MPFFKSTYNILKSPEEDEVFNPNWMDSDSVILPPKKNWDYGREMIVEDVDIWEVLYEGSGGIGVYASWTPYAEFYLITTGLKSLLPGQRINDRIWETYYGADAQKKVYNRSRELGITLPIFKTWVEDTDISTLHQSEKKIILI